MVHDLLLLVSHSACSNSQCLGRCVSSLHVTAIVPWTAEQMYYKFSPPGWQLWPASQHLAADVGRVLSERVASACQLERGPMRFSLVICFVLSSTYGAH